MSSKSKPTVSDIESKKRFDRAVKEFKQMQKVFRKEKTPVQRMIRLMQINQNTKNYYKRHGHKEFTFDLYPTKRVKEQPGKTLLREVVTNYADDILCLKGKDLDVMAKEFGVDPNLPVREKQETVFLAALDRLAHGKSKQMKMAKQRKE